MTLIALQSIRKHYDDRVILDGVSLSIGDDERVGLVGPNGSGKSTLMRILAGTEIPDAGERTFRRDLRIGAFEQEPVLEPTRSVRAVVHDGLVGRDAVLADLARLHATLESHTGNTDALLVRQARLEEELERLGGHDVEHRIDALLSNLGLRDADAPCGALSGGERRRVALARMLIAKPALLLLDEPTNHLDAFVIDWLEGFLLETRVPLCIVTHDRYFLDRVVDRIVELDRARIYSYDGGYGDYLVARAERIDVERDAESARQNLLRRETAWMRRGPPARTTKAKARIDRFHEIVGAAPTPLPDELELQIPSGPRLGARVIRLEGASKRFGDRVVVPPIDLEIGPGERIGIVGPNGAGKTTLMRMAIGALSTDSGRVEVGETVRVATIGQLRDDLDPARTVLQEVAGGNDYVVVGERSVRIEAFLDRFLFPGTHKHVPVGRLSGGERNRVLLAKLFCAGGNVLALDEPTNDLDLATLRALEEALIAFPGAVLLVSHDRWFLDRVTTRIVHLDGQGHARAHFGDMSALLDLLAAEREAARPEPAPTKVAQPREVKPKRRAPWQQKELDALPARIASAEADIEALDARLADPALYTGPKLELERVRANRVALQSELEVLYARWEELESLRS
ncbi:MAG: ABC-F family ATP-binding cassette domain-containing protein [Planctomycetota bacterium]